MRSTPRCVMVTAGCAIKPLYHSRISLRLCARLAVRCKLSGADAATLHHRPRLPTMLLEEFDYHLPRQLIAQRPLAERDASRLLLVDRATQRIEDRAFRELP